MKLKNWTERPVCYNCNGETNQPAVVTWCGEAVCYQCHEKLRKQKQARDFIEGAGLLPEDEKKLLLEKLKTPE